jgi:hypothetical protein
MQLLLSERFYVEEFGTGAPPLPYRAYLRMSMKREATDGEDRFIVKSQSFLPFQAEEWGRDYHSPILVEERAEFDTSWRFRRMTHWTWVALPSKDENRSYTNTLSYGGATGGQKLFWGGANRWPGRRRVRLAAGQCIVQDNGAERVLFSPEGGRLPLEAMLFLLPVAADLMTGAKVECQCMLTGGRYSLVIEPVLRSDGTGAESMDVVFKDEDRLHVRPSHDPYLYLGKRARYYAPSASQFEYEASQLGWWFRQTTEDEYFKALAGFLRDFGIKRLTDSQGHVVDLPLGLGRTQDTVR